MGEFQPQTIKGLECHPFPNLYGDGRDDLALFYFSKGAITQL